MTSCNLHGNASSSPDINLFVLTTGRLPHLSDEVPPWHYRGWLLYQVQLADDHPKSPGRWNHHLRTLEAAGFWMSLSRRCGSSNARSRTAARCWKSAST